MLEKSTNTEACMRAHYEKEQAMKSFFEKFFGLEDFSQKLYEGSLEFTLKIDKTSDDRLKILFIGREGNVIWYSVVTNPNQKLYLLLEVPNATT